MHSSEYNDQNLEKLNQFADCDYVKLVLIYIKTMVNINIESNEIPLSNLEFLKMKIFMDSNLIQVFGILELWLEGLTTG